MNILFSGNDKVFDGIMMCLLSIIMRSDSPFPLNVYVLTMDATYLKEEYIAISDEKIDYLNTVVKEFNPEHNITKIDVTDIYKKEFLNSPNEQCYCSPYTLLRLFIDTIDNIPDKILYLDVDLMICKDLRKLYDIDITDYEYAAAGDHYGNFLISPNYINAGVLLFNMAKCKETGLFDKAREIIKTKKYLFADQDAIWHSTTKKMKLPHIFNDQKFLYKDTVIRHFSKRLFYLPYPHTENIKQWHVNRMIRVFGYTCFDDIIYKYIYYKERYSHEQQINA